MYGAIPIGGKALLQTTRIQQTGQAGSTHSYSEEEVCAFVNFINNNLGTDVELQGRLPLDANNHQHFFDALADGVILCKMVNFVAKDSINLKHVINKPDMQIHFKTQNLNTALSAMKELGIKTVNIGAEDILKGQRHLVLSLVWQIIKFHLLHNINLVSHPEIVHLLTQGEDTKSFATMDPERVILRWFNYNLQKAGHNRVVNNFGEDLMDGQNYLVLMSEIAPHIVSKQVLMEQNPQTRTELVCNLSKQMGVDQFLTPKNILEGNNNLNLAFTADMFNKYPAIRVDSLNELQSQALAEANEKMKREYEEMEKARAFRWAAEEAQRKMQWEQEEMERQRLRENWEKDEEEKRRNLEEERRKLEEEQRLLTIQNSQQVTLGDHDPHTMAKPVSNVYPPVPPVSSIPPMQSTIPPVPSSQYQPQPTPSYVSAVNTNVPPPPGGYYPPGGSPYDTNMQVPPHGLPPGGYGLPPGGYGQPPGGHGLPPGGYGLPPGGHGLPPGGYGLPPGGYGQPPGGYGQPPGGYGQPPGGYGLPPGGYGQPPGGNVYGGYPQQTDFMYQQQQTTFYPQQLPTVYQTTTVYYPSPMATGMPHIGGIGKFKKFKKFKKYKKYKF